MLCKAQNNALSEREWGTLMRKATEWVTQNLNNGTYKGQVSGGNRSGLGVYRWSDGTWCWGRWRNGAMDGKAIYIVPDGYEVLNCPDCVYYVGDYRSGKKSGTGTCYDKYGKLIYHGRFSDDRPAGAYPSSGYIEYKFECIEYSGGDMYIGETDNGVRHGYGIYLWSDGRAWYGPLENGERGGYGLFLPYKGNCETGQWTGDTYTEVERACAYCRGTGQNMCPVCSGRGGYMFYSTWMTCQSCMGRGKQMCMVCRGNGKTVTGSTADRVFTKMDSPYASAETSSSNDKISKPIMISCSACLGTGKNFCYGCSGTGVVPFTKLICGHCSGKGKIVCPLCSGTGKIQLKNQIYVPPVNSGSVNSNEYQDVNNNLGKTTCKNCNGTGNCSFCKGKGWYKNYEADKHYDCFECHGSGRCQICHGKGIID